MYFSFQVTMAGVRDRIDFRMFHLRDWDKDDEVPASLLDLVSKCRLAAKQVESQDTESRARAPMLIVCATGVHRAGTFAALDILLNRMQVSN